MLKNKSKLIAFILIAILLFFVPISFADDGTDIAPISEEAPTSENPEQSSESVPENIQTNMKSSDVYLSGEDIVIDYIVDGNVFIFGKNVTINSQIGGDVFVYATNLTIGTQGAIYSNLFAAAQNIDIQGIAYDIYTFSPNITISGYVYRDIKVACGNLNLFGKVARNAYVICDSMNFNQENDTDQTLTVTSQGVINGNLEYSSTNEISIPENTVVGETNFTKIQSPNSENTVQTYLLSLGTFLVTTIVIWLLCLWLAPKFLENKTTNLASKKILHIIGFGILGFILIPILSIILLIINITTTIAFLLIALYIILLLISSSIFSISATNCIVKKLKINKKIGTLGILILTSIVLWLLQLIPTVGGVISLIYIILGLGIFLSSLVLHEKTKID